MKTLDDLMRDLKVKSLNKLYDKFDNYWSYDYSVAILYDIFEEKFKINLGCAYNDTYYPPYGNIAVTWMFKPKEPWWEYVFTPEEKEDVKKNYKGDYKRWLKAHPEAKSMEERTKEHFLKKFADNWNECWMRTLRKVADFYQLAYRP